MANLPLKLVKKLYYKEKLSTIEVGKRINISPWVVLKFMKRMDLPRRTFKEANAVTFKKKPPSFSVKSNLSFKEKQLKLAAIMLYWAEGSKGSGDHCTVDFCNSEPEMIKIFLKFLREICRVDEKRLRVLLYCYADQDIRSIKRYWQKTIKIPLKQFIKPYIRKDFLLEKSGKMKYGLVHIRYSDKKLLYKIQDWIKTYLKSKNIG